MNTKEILIAARALIADPAHWAQRVFARDEDGDAVGACRPSASCWCGLGAIIKIESGAPDDGESDAQHALAQACQDLFGAGDPVDVNDGHNGHARILKAFDHAIAEAA